MIAKLYSVKFLKRASLSFAILINLFFIVTFVYLVLSDQYDFLICKLMLIGFVMSLIGTLVLYYGIKAITQRIHTLKEVAEEIGKSNFDVMVDVRSSDDFGVLARSIDRMRFNLKQNFDALNKASRLEKEKAGSDRELKESVEKLKRTEIAITNVLEDLVESKKEVENKVEERTNELSEEKNKLDQIAQNMTIGAILLDEKGEVSFINNEAKKILNLRINKGKRILTKLYEKFKDYTIKEYSEKCTVSKNSVDIKEAEADDTIYEILFRCLRNKNGKVFGRLIWIRDITDEKLLERSKSELVAVASHQLKTPLTVTKGNTEMLLDGSLGKLNREQREVIQQTSDANRKLISLVNEMLDITRIEKNRLLLDLVEVDVVEIMDYVIDTLKEYSDRHGIQLCYEKKDGQFPFVFADKLRVQQIFQNLVENAIQYSKATNENKENCSVLVKLDYDDTHVYLEVKDNGIGIPKKEQGRIFERFYRASNAVKFASSGTGLGLYIVKSVVLKLGGEIEFQSEEGSGTTFNITLPVKK